MKQWIILILTFPYFVYSQSTLTDGDIAIVAYTAANPDEFSFVCLESIESGTQIVFTDKGWTSDNAFRTGEGLVNWTASQDYSPGDVIVITDLGTMSLAQSGDQIIAYQGSDSDPTFLCAINLKKASWQTDASSANTSRLPTNLINGETAMAYNKYSAYYNSSLADTKPNLQTDINSTSNWQGSASTRTNYDPSDNGPTDFSIYYKYLSDASISTAYTLHSGNRLYVDNNSTLTLSNTLSLEKGSKLIIESGSSLVCGANALSVTEADFIIKGNLSSSGTHTYYRPISSGIYHYVSSPLTTCPISQLNLTGTDEGFVYSESEAIWYHYDPSSGSNSFPSNLIQGQGVAINSSTTDTIQFSGTFSTGDFNSGISVSYTVSIDEQWRAWNLVGNPYPASLDVLSFLSENNSIIEQTLYVWDDTDYSALNSLTSENSIAPCQAFYVKTLSSLSTPQALTFNSSSQINIDNSSTWHRGEEVDEIILSLSGNGLENSLRIFLTDFASSDLDRGMDAVKLKGNPEIAFYSLLGEEHLEIQALPFQEGLTIPLGIDLESSGDYILSIEKSDNYKCTLIDVETQTLRNLDSTLNLSLEAVQGLVNRFRLVLNTGSPQFDEQVLEYALYVYSNSLHNKSEQSIKWSLFDIQGRKVLEREIMPKGKIDLSYLSHSCYVLQYDWNGGFRRLKLLL
jgi:hypothetical protein